MPSIINFILTYFIQFSKFITFASKNRKDGGTLSFADQFGKILIIDQSNFNHFKFAVV